MFPKTRKFENFLPVRHLLTKEKNGNREKNCIDMTIFDILQKKLHKIEYDNVILVMK